VVYPLLTNFFDTGLNMKQRIFGTLVALAMLGCATPAAPLKTSKIFDAELARKDTQKGSNTIRGSALIRQQGGGVVTCAGQTVTAIPATAYADERIWAIYGSYNKGYRPSYLGNVEFENEPLEFRQFTLSTTCDAQGYFKFEKVADASFYIVTTITWQAGNSQQGGD
jgi:hypothetical protein